MTTGQKFLEHHKPQLLELCRRYPVERLYLFGSILTDEFDMEKSDVDVQAFLTVPATRWTLVRKFWGFGMNWKRCSDGK